MRRPAPRWPLPVLGTLALLLSPLPARAEPPQKVTTVEGVTEYRLANGARVLLFPDPSASTVTVNLTVLVGSRLEGYGETGMAHLLEHMNFKGTPTFRHVPKALRDHGAQFNGTTNTDRTNYFETMPASDENLEFGIRLEADRLVHSFIKREDLASEMTVVRNEFERGENSPQSVLMQRLVSAAYEWHNYGKSTIGNRSDIERVPIENLQAFYRNYYQPDNVVLIVTGKFEEPRALALVQQYLGALPRPKRKLPTAWTEEPPQDGERVVTLRRVGKVSLVAAAYHIPAAAHPDMPALTVLANVLGGGGGFGGRGRRGGGGGGSTGRLYKALVETKKATRVFATARGQHDPGLMTVVCQCEPGQLDAARTILLDVLENLARQPITEAEVDRVKLRFRRQQEMMTANSSRLASQLSEASARGDWRLLFLERDRLKAVTAADVNRVAAHYLLRSNRSVGIFLPSETPRRAAIPATPDIGALVKNYKGSATVARGEAFDPTPENLEKRTTRRDLPSGVKAALLPKRNTGETVTLRLNLRFGNAESLRGQRTTAELLGALMMRGTKEHTREQLQDEMTRLNVRLGVSSGPGELSVTISTRKANLPDALRLMREVLRAPAFPAKDFAIMKRGQIRGLEASRVEPSALASNLLARKMNPFPPSDPRYVRTPDEQIAALEAVTLDQVRQLYQEQLSGTVGELAVVGDFDPESTVTLVAEALKDWKSAVPYKRVPHPAKADTPGARATILTPDKANAQFDAGLACAVTDTDTDYPALVLGNFIFGGGTLSSRLGNRVRQKEGLSYGVSSRFSASSLDPDGRFTMTAICNPLNIERVDRAVAEELTRFLQDGPSEQEVTEARKAYLESAKVRRASDDALASQLASGLFTGRTFAFTAEQERRIGALTPAEILAAFKKHVSPDRLIIIWAGDFKKASGQK